jgi:hypothetical protein
MAADRGSYDWAPKPEGINRPIECSSQNSDVLACDSAGKRERIISDCDGPTEP